MKKSAAFLGASIALTLVFYLLAYYLLPGPPPSAAMVLLFAGVALAIVAGIQAIRKKKPDDKTKTVVLLLLSLAAMPSLLSCKSASRGPGGPGRVTGTGLLLAGEKEEPGYGLYSYALLAHAPTAAELPRCKAFFQALLQLPTATSLSQYVPRQRINITYVPLTSASTGWDVMALDAKVDWVLAHYDFARSAVILAGLGHRVRGGPVIASALAPMTSGQDLHPLLVQDLSTAQPALLTEYVAQFVSQVGADRFWEPNALESFSLGLRNGLEVAGGGLGMSKDAVSSWVKFFK